MLAILVSKSKIINIVKSWFEIPLAILPILVSSRISLPMSVNKIYNSLDFDLNKIKLNKLK